MRWWKPWLWVPDICVVFVSTFRLYFSPGLPMWLVHRMSQNQQESLVRDKIVFTHRNIIAEANVSLVQGKTYDSQTSTKECGFSLLFFTLYRNKKGKKSHLEQGSCADTKRRAITLVENIRKKERTRMQRKKSWQYSSCTCHWVWSAGTVHLLRDTSQYLGSTDFYSIQWTSPFRDAEEKLKRSPSLRPHMHKMAPKTLLFCHNSKQFTMFKGGWHCKWHPSTQVWVNKLKCFCVDPEKITHYTLCRKLFHVLSDAADFQERLSPSE